MSEYIEKVERNGKILAIITRAKIFSELSKENKMVFVTPDEFPFQIGVHSRERGEIIKPHFHLPFIELKDFPVQEFFYVISGSVKIDLYDERENDQKVAEVIINEGDTIVLNTGHGFTFLDDAKLIELKQGPYRGRDQEKRFINNG
jgi:mannose-6-phosphate isomerase-like protein (cupin superfamily)